MLSIDVDDCISLPSPSSGVPRESFAIRWFHLLQRAKVSKEGERGRRRRRRRRTKRKRRRREGGREGGREGR